MYIIGKYKGTDSMAQLICDNHIMLLIMRRFGISLGFADKTICEVCTDNGVDCDTFLAVVNLILRRADSSYKPCLEGVKVEGLVDYLRRSHDYYLSVRLPEIGVKLHSVLSGDKISALIIRYFEDYVRQINEHMKYEETKLFPYIENLAKGNITEGYSVEVFTKKHDHIDEPLTEFKDVIIKYYRAENNEEVVRVIYNVLSCANDLSLHNLVEDRLLVPLIQKMEENER